MQLVLTLSHHTVTSLRDLVPDSPQVAEWLRHNETAIVGQLLEYSVIGIQCLQGLNAGGVEQANQRENALTALLQYRS